MSNTSSPEYLEQLAALQRRLANTLPPHDHPVPDPVKPFHPDCSGCKYLLEFSKGGLGLNNVSAAPSTRRHPESDRKEVNRKQLQQCQYNGCMKPRGGDISLRSCQRCMVEKYCSKECQTNAWPSHKAECKRRRMHSAQPSSTPLEALRAYATKHTPALSEAGCRALKLSEDPTRGLREVMMLTLGARLESGRPETAFFARSAEVMSLDVVATLSRNDPMAWRKRLQDLHDAQRHKGVLGAFLVYLGAVSDQGPVAQVITVCVDGRALTENVAGMEWKETLMTRLNEGVVL